MALGRILGYEPEGSGVNLYFQEGKARIQFCGERTVRVFAGADEADTGSWAVEKEPEKKVEFSLVQQKGYILIRSKKLTVRVRENLRGDYLTPAGICVSEELEPEAPAGQPVCLRRALHPGERIYGLGDKPGFLDRRGYRWTMWNSDIPDTHMEAMESLYKSVPFFISLRKGHCYGFFLDNPAKSVFDMGMSDADSYSVFAAGGSLNYYFFWGESPKEVLAAYTRLTGTTPLPQL